MKSARLPAVVVADSSGTPRALVGIPGTAGQQLLFGGSGLNGDMRSGFRVNGGVWLDSERQWAVSGEYFFLGSANDSGVFASQGTLVLSRPFLNTATGRPDAELVAFPGVLSGAASANMRNVFNGAGVFLQRSLCCDFDPCNSRGYRLDLMAGYRYLDLNDNLRLREDLVSQASGQIGAAPVPFGTQFVVNDHFRTENTFSGGFLGLAGSAQTGNWSVNFRGGASLGDLHRALTISGSTLVTIPGQGPTARTGGLLAQPSNIGGYSSDAFTVVPEFGMNFGYQVTSHLRVQLGYTFLYMPNVWRVGDQIDRVVDPAQLRGLPSAVGRPAPTFASTGAFVQGVNLGLALRY